MISTTNSHTNASLCESVCDCCICMSDVENGEFKVLNCGHKYHKVCIDDWTKRNNTCPMCRQIVVQPSTTREKVVWIENDAYSHDVTHWFCLRPNTLEQLRNKYKWQKRKCNSSNTHTIKWLRPQGMGVVGICSCGCIQPFAIVY